jgi:hypothetical protein
VNIVIDEFYVARLVGHQRKSLEMLELERGCRPLGHLPRDRDGGEAMNLVNETGNRYGRLVVNGEPRRGSDGYLRWPCICDCGEAAVVTGASLRSGRTQSCGYLRRERVGEAHRTHGLRAAPDYMIWSGIIQRCRNPSAPDYHHYGDRGITVCERGYKFENFHADMGPRPSKHHSIDRIDVNGNYEPGNCRWVTTNNKAASAKSAQ